MHDISSNFPDIFVKIILYFPDIDIFLIFSQKFNEKNITFKRYIVTPQIRKFQNIMDICDYADTQLTKAAAIGSDFQKADFLIEPDAIY